MNTLLSHFKPPKTTKPRVARASLFVYVLSFGSVPVSVINCGDVAASINQSLARLMRGGERSVAVVFVVAVNGAARAAQSRGHVAALVNQIVTGVNHFLARLRSPKPDQ